MRNSRPHLRGWLLAVGLAAGALVAGGCGSGSNSDSASANSNSRDAARVKFAQCMRQNGIDVPDSPGQGGGANALQNVDRNKLRAATKACQKYQRGAFGNLSSSQQQEFRDAFTKFSSCMRQHGVEVPDITAGGGPPAGGAGGAQLDRNDPKVKAALQSCQSNLPQRGALGGGGPGSQQ